MSAGVTVTQADREAAADYASAHPDDDATFSFEMREGAADNHYLVQAFAVHRAAALADLAEQASIDALKEASRIALHHSNYGHVEGNRRAFAIASDIEKRITARTALSQLAREQGK